MLLVFYVMMLAINIGPGAASVFCQDTHATDWTPLGYSCPINCPAVVAAVKRLKEIDYQELLPSQQSSYSSYWVNTTNYDSDEISGEPMIPGEPSEGDEDNFLRQNEIIRRKLTPSHYIQMYRILMNQQKNPEIQALFKNAAWQLKNDSCRSITNWRKQKFLITKQCARRSAVRDEFIDKFTEILNKYSTTDYFDTRLTTIILEKLLGDRVDLQLGMLNVHKLLKQLNYVVSVHKTQARAASHTITLKSKYCLNVYMPGCFCIPNYVENNGQCVRPNDCFPEDMKEKVREYLKRINVH